MTLQAGEIVGSLTENLSRNPSATTDSDAGTSIEIIRADELCGPIADRWLSLRRQNGHLISPYFDIEFTKAVASVRDDVEIAIDRDADGDIKSFFPYQRTEPQIAEPVGGRLNDIHGVIGPAHGHAKLLARVMKAAGLKSFAFHALSDVDSSIKPYVFRQLDSHYIDLSEGWTAYKSWSKKSSKTMKRQGQKSRALEREVGPLRFEFDCCDANVLERLIELKRAKYQRTNTFDILSVTWAADLLREISQVNTGEFRGILSALYAGDHLVAVHFGMLNEHLLHYWFPIFDPEFSKYSPGTELLLRVAQTACELGYEKVDLGYGDDAYKFKFCNGHETVSCGRFTHSRMGFAVAKRRYIVRQQLKSIPMKPLVKTVLRSVFPGFGGWNFK